MINSGSRKSSSLILLMFLLVATLSLHLPSVSASTVALLNPLSGTSFESIADPQMGRTMRLEVEDYSETGANNHHDPPPPTPTQP